MFTTNSNLTNIKKQMQKLNQLTKCDYICKIPSYKIYENCQSSSFLPSAADICF